jgi:hypothetical protein
MRGKRAKRLRREAAESQRECHTNHDSVHVAFLGPIRVGRRHGGPALGAFPYPTSRREGDHFDVLTMTDQELNTIRERLQSDADQNHQDQEQS